MSVSGELQRAFLLRVARKALIDRGFEVDFLPEVFAEIRGLASPATTDGTVRDLRTLPWCSIDNDDSRDLDQLTVAVPLPGSNTRLLVAVADVAALVMPNSALDRHAAPNTTSIYTPPQTFPMLPDPLGTDLTSLVQGKDRLAMVVELIVDDDGVGGTPGEGDQIQRETDPVSHDRVRQPDSRFRWICGSGQSDEDQRENYAPRR